jgi:hypothetical protein
MQSSRKINIAAVLLLKSFRVTPRGLSDRHSEVPASPRNVGKAMKKGASNGESALILQWFCYFMGILIRT